MPFYQVQHVESGWSGLDKMLKLLLNHWQAHREPLPFVLTDDPLYCSHLTKSPFPEVYSVNRVNPIFEEDEPTEDNILKRSLSEERRENETRNSDDTGYSSARRRSTSLTDDVGSLETRRMSSDSDEDSQPEEVVVAADVHRVSYPEDVIVLSTHSESSNNSQASSAISYDASHSGSSSNDTNQEPYDSLTMSIESENGQKKTVSTNSKRHTSLVREKLQRLLEKGNNGAFQDSLESKSEKDIEKSRHDLMKSLTRALNNKVPNREGISSSSDSTETVTRTDSALDVHQTRPKSLDRKSNSSSTSPKTLYAANQAETNGITRQDESSSSSSATYAKPRKHRNKNSSSEKDSNRNSSTSNQESSDSKKSSHKCRFCESANRPMAFHQLLPGHWSYDNVYLPNIPPGMCYSCMYHHATHPYQQSSDDDVFYPRFYQPPNAPRSRHSWAHNSRLVAETPQKRNHSPEGKNKKENGLKVASTRYSPDGSSRETDSSFGDTGQLTKPNSERRSLREPKKCKCDHCLDSTLDKHRAALGSHTCPCHCLSHNRRVKFASDTDVSQHRHMQPPLHFGKNAEKLVNGDPINAAFVMSLPHLNGHAMSNGSKKKENGLNNKPPAIIPRGLKEPIKMDELYRSYPMNMREWDAHYNYRRNFIKKRRKRALNMVLMAIGIIVVVGLAVTLTFVFLRIRRTT